MTPTEPKSLATVVDEVAEAHFQGMAIAAGRREELALWTARRQGLPGSYAGLPAPTEAERRGGIRVFTGEAIRSGAGSAHVLGEEACRALLLLGVRTPEVAAAMERAGAGMTARLEASRQRELGAGREWRGEYCCGTCSCALWRHLAAGGLPAAGPERWLAAGAASVRAHRRGDGRWRRFPFFYTLLALIEMPAELAAEELRYALPACERVARGHRRTEDRYAPRRRLLAERVLARF